MSTKYITTTYNYGYELSSVYSAVSVTSTGAVNGTQGPDVYPRYIFIAAGDGLKLLYPASAYNFGDIRGGAGGNGAGAYYYAGSKHTYPATTGAHGGAGVTASAGAHVSNYAVIIGGKGGNGGAGNAGLGVEQGGAGGDGGVGVAVNGAGGFIYNTVNHHISGGVGGAGGYGPQTGGSAGYGGYGIFVGPGVQGSNYGFIYGGNGGSGGVGGSQGGRGGRGGMGAFVDEGNFVNRGYIFGGNGGVGATNGFTGAGARLFGGVLENDGGATISGATGVYMDGGGTVTNFGVIEGTGGAAVDFIGPGVAVAEAGATFIGTIIGGDSGTLELGGGSGTVSGLGGFGTLSGSAAVTFAGLNAYGVNAGATLTVAAGQVLGYGRTLFSAGAMTILALVDQGALATDSGGVITVGDGDSLQAQGVIANAGTLVVHGAASNATLRVLAPGLTLNGGGTVSMSGTKAIITGATSAATLSNADNTISGTGVIGANSLTLINESAGVIDAVGAAGLAVATKGATLINQGLMEATGGGILAITNTTVTNLGGTILATDGSPVKLQNVVVHAGSIAATGSGVVKLNVAGGELDGATSPVFLSGVMALVTSSNETLAGSIVNAGKINLTAGGTTADLIVGAAGATLSGGGQVNLSNAVGNRIYGLAAADTLTNANNRIDGAGVLGNGVMTLVNQAAGQIIGNQNLAFTIDTGTNTITNAGLIENVGKGGTVVKSAVANTGTLLAATVGTLTLAGAVTGTGVGQINGGTLYVQQAYAEKVTFAGTTGVLELGASQTFTGKITGLSHTGTSWLDLVDIGFFAAKTKATFSGTTASGTLTVTDGTHTAHITLLGNYTAAAWTVSADGHGGTKVVDPSIGAALAQAFASFQRGPPARLAIAPPHPAPRLPVLHVQA